MSDDITCNACGKSGRRPRFKIVPKGWLYAETILNGDDVEGSTVYTAVCSAECAAQIWNIGPGDLRKPTGTGCAACEDKLDYIEKVVSSHQRLDIELERMYTIRGALRAFWIAIVRLFNKLTFGAS